MNTSKSPLFFLFIYILSIVIFGFIYKHISEGFYHTTVQHEKRTVELKDTIDKMVEHGITANIDEFCKKDPGRYSSLDFCSISKLRLEVTVTGRSTLISKIELPRLSSINHKSRSASYYKSFDKNFLSITVSMKLGGNELVAELLENSSNVSSDEVEQVLRTLFNYRSGSLTYKPELRLNVYSPEFEENIYQYSEKYYEIINGFPDKATGSFARLLYFSAITQSTLGYGDIVPISDVARFWVSIQSVAGIILIGLFLNNIANKASKKKNDN